VIRQRGLGLALLGSLAVNVFLLGLLAVPYFMHGHAPFGPCPSGLPPLMGEAVGPENRPPEGRERERDRERDRDRDQRVFGAPVLDALARAAKPTREELLAGMKEIGKARHDLAQILTAEPFDPKRFSEAALNVQAKIRVVQDLAIPILGQAADGLSPSDRLKLLPLTINPGGIARLSHGPHGAPRTPGGEVPPPAPTGTPPNDGPPRP
jgi:uncharacterized membrane protein